jgi:ATP-dependent DNA helicase RecQ
MLNQDPLLFRLTPDSLFQEALLKDWRRQQAQSQAVPPYVVFHDRTLLEIASSRPQDFESLAGISGVGKAKLSRYGDELLKLIGQ